MTVASNGTQANARSLSPTFSADGRFVAFASSASNLVPGDTNISDDAFVHDRHTGQTTRVSVAGGGTQSNCGSGDPSLNADGRFVAFSSCASNLVLGDTNSSNDVFVHDRLTGQTTRVSVASGGTQGNCGSGDPSLSADGRFVAFSSCASSLVPGDTNFSDDVFVHDRLTGLTARVSLASDGAQGNRVSMFPALSADSRVVAFLSFAFNLVPGDTNARPDVFVHDRLTGLTTRVSVASDGAQASALCCNTPTASSLDGRVVAFESDAPNLGIVAAGTTPGIFVHDRQTGQTTRVSVASDGTPANGQSFQAALSGDGRLVAFQSSAFNLVSDDTNASADVFVRDRQTGQTTRVSVASDGTQGNQGSFSPTFSADGRVVAFGSSASNLVPSDTNGVSDAFVHIIGAGLAPDAPSSLAAAVIGSTVTLNWSAPSALAVPAVEVGDQALALPTSYVIEAGSGPGTRDLATFNTGSTTTSITVTGVPSGIYFVRVRSMNLASVSEPSNEVIVTVGGDQCTSAPGAPSGLTATVNGTTVTLAWIAPAGCPPTEYVVEAGSSVGMSNLANVTTGRATTALTAVASPGNYFVRVRGRNGFGASAPSNEVIVTVP